MFNAFRQRLVSALVNDSGAAAAETPASADDEPLGLSLSPHSPPLPPPHRTQPLPTLLLIHGFRDSNENVYGRLQQRLARGGGGGGGGLLCRVYYFSYGDIDNVAALVALLANALRKLLDSAQTHSLHVAAHSFGGILLGLALSDMLAHGPQPPALDAAEAASPAVYAAPPPRPPRPQPSAPPAPGTAPGAGGAAGLPPPYTSEALGPAAPPAYVPADQYLPPPPTTTTTTGGPPRRGLPQLHRIRNILVLDSPLAGVDVGRCKAFATAKAGLLMTSARNVAQGGRKKIEAEGEAREREMRALAAQRGLAPHVLEAQLAQHRRDVAQELRQYDRRGLWLGAAAGAAAFLGGAYGLLKGIVPLLQAHGAGLRLLTEQDPDDQAWLARGRAAYGEMGASPHCRVTHVRVKGCPDYGHWLRPFTLEHVDMVEWETWRDGSVAVDRFDRTIQNHRHMLQDDAKIAECAGYLGFGGHALAGSA